ncbi:Protein of unknown function [Gryllus bimaculatus]|nr:Protein of unknown function [Gryllus bimaculatus]
MGSRAPRDWKADAAWVPVRNERRGRETARARRQRLLRERREHLQPQEVRTYLQLMFFCAIYFLVCVTAICAFFYIQKQRRMAAATSAESTCGECQKNG